MKKIYVPEEQSEEIIFLDEVPLKNLILVKKQDFIIGIISYCYKTKCWSIVTPIINKVKYFTSQEELIREGIKEGYSFYIE